NTISDIRTSDDTVVATIPSSSPRPVWVTLQPSELFQVSSFQFREFIRPATKSQWTLERSRKEHATRPAGCAGAQSKNGAGCPAPCESAVLRRPTAHQNSNFSPSSITRLPPVNCFWLRNSGEVTLEYIVLSALFSVPISTPVWKTVGCASAKLRWLKMFCTDTRNWMFEFSVMRKALTVPMFQMLKPGDRNVLRPTLVCAPSWASANLALGLSAT